MKVLVCGSRNFTDRELCFRELDKASPTSIIHGAARGADTLGGEYAKERGIPVRAFPADWATYGKAAGPIRNTQMLEEGKPDVVVAFPLEGSKGTLNMINQAKAANVPVQIVEIANAEID